MRRSTRCIPLARVDLADSERRKVDRYLDVTKAALLFGGRVLLVEGIAEALLLPIIAEHFVLKKSPEKLRLFRSAVFVPIDGVDFLPYANLLTASLNGVRIAERVVVMTEGTKEKPKRRRTGLMDQKTPMLMTPTKRMKKRKAITMTPPRPKNRPAPH
jgi:putative ATP-dependent endonuclease of OLD family